MNRKKVAKWLAAAGSLAVLTSCRGELVPYAAERTAEFLTAEPVILRDREAGRRFLMETVSAAEREGRQEIVVTGKRQLVRYAGDRADVSRSGKYFKAGSGDQECER